MSESMVLEIGQQGLRLALLVAAPLLLASLVVGLLVSLFQVATSLQDATLTFVPKIFAVGVMLLVMAHWITRTLVEFTERLIGGIPRSDRMIEALAGPDVAEVAGRFAIVLMRVSGLVAFCPILSAELLPRRFRVSLALALAVVLFPVVAPAAAVPSGVGGWLVAGVRELAVGLGLGLTARVVFDGIEGASRLVAGQSGFALATMLDPLTGSQSVSPALFHTLLTTTLILTADLHHLFIRGLVHSYTLLPPAELLPRTEGFGATVAALGTRLFGVAVQLAGPALVVTYAVDLVLILVGRAVPQIPVFIVGYPLKVAAGVIAMTILAFLTGSALRWIGQTFSSDGAALLSAFATG